MKRVRIRGLVRIANNVRQELAGPLSPERLVEVAQHVRQSLHTVQGILADEGATLQALPGPTRKAYQYLAGLDFAAVATQDAAPTPVRRPGSVSFRRLRSYLDGVLDALARQPDGPERGRIHQSIRATNGQIEDYLRRHDVRPGELKAEARAVRGWLAYHADGANFAAYGEAVSRARPVFQDAVERIGQGPGPVLVHFRPMKAACRVRRRGAATRVKMPTPHLLFDRATFAALAAWTLGGSGQGGPVLDAMARPDYRALADELEWLGGLLDHAAGVYHDLAAAFQRVNAEYFGDELAPPRLTWSRTFTVRKFAHYDEVRDLVMVSSSIDRADVPGFVVDFLVYHELLHKKLGVRGPGSSGTGHPAAFRRAERRFRRWRQAEAVLARLASAPY